MKACILCGIHKTLQGFLECISIENIFSMVLSTRNVKFRFDFLYFKSFLSSDIVKSGYI